MALRLDYAGHKPHQGTSGAAGLDLYAAEDSRIADGTIELVGTGTRLAIPSGFFGMLAIRSSLGARGVALANGVGIIDSDYRGEVKAAVHNLSGEDHPVVAGRARGADHHCAVRTGIAARSDRVRRDRAWRRRLRIDGEDINASRRL